MFQNNIWVNGEIQRESKLPGEQWKQGAAIKYIGMQECQVIN